MNHRHILERWSTIHDISSTCSLPIQRYLRPASSQKQPCVLSLIEAITLRQSQRRMGMKMAGCVLERALIFLRFRLSLRDLFFFHFSLMLCAIVRCRTALRY